ncbi:hypothetical protein GobsT_68540 [Gemmata obscuriglobus]|uniref:Uncharacterized protein n=1 Tax=Gemmata obscuriglobus TaxID=114 RepID=A0A2Z3HGA7_9BACT|nr:hypothetical protein [Gemmata obscuriglobus]AWM42005.1 hypothetical protein C1280_36795 [Gemmata obscuriglobus]QEG32005.1 hypothetical protein GobsT_68540 [Gemmata obscuriglobus]VTS11355.1 Uncharacterized protein OS=Deinococcus phoenicis GN=DEIPH_ctg079orf0023 PE=4 SV=1: DUF3108 [Gemmata obscuriglobus UQM 2246]
MSRFAVLLAAFAVVPSGAAAPVPKHLMRTPEPVYYYPLVPGTKWVYTDCTLIIDRVEDSKDVKGAKVVTVVAPNGQGVNAVNDVMQVTDGGLARLGLGSGTFNAPLVFLQSPVRVGTTWEVKTSGAEGTGTIAALEKITVAAGTFDAVRVDLAQTQANGQRIVSAWYAPNVGLVRMTDNGKDVWVLQSFELGKPAQK